MKEISILAVDPGTANLGYVVLRGNLATKAVFIACFGVLKTQKVDGSIRERLDLLGGQVKDIIAKEKPAYFVMEDFIEQGKRVGKTYKEMAFLTEHLRLVGSMCSVPTTIYTNARWKKLTLKSSGVNKLQVQHYVSHKLIGSAALLGKAPSHVWDSVAIGYCKWLELIK